LQVLEPHPVFFQIGAELFAVLHLKAGSKAREGLRQFVRKEGAQFRKLLVTGVGKIDDQNLWIGRIDLGLANLLGQT
jgi:hypothetical protein